MIGCYDFCGHYEWTFEWLEQRFGRDALLSYWREAIAGDSQIHAAMLIQKKGVEGMEEYWGHTLAEEGAGYTSVRSGDSFRLDMHDCPSKGFLIANGLENYHDYCDHCIGWIGPVMEKVGYVVDHEHNHCGKCWWAFRPQDSPNVSAPSVAITGAADWSSENPQIDRFEGAVTSETKKINP
jgi:hypothetical protein